MDAPVTDENGMRWQPGARRGHYEVWYATLTHLASRTGFWIRYTLEAPRPGDGEPYAQLWFSRFSPESPEHTFGVSRRLPIGDFVAAADPFSVEIAGSKLSLDEMRGALSGGGHEIAWDLRWPRSLTTFQHLPSLVYKLERVDTKVQSPNPDLAISGTIEVDGHRYHFDGDPGGQSHVWGRKHAYQWAWSHCNGFDGAPHALFESISVKLKRGQIILPTITLFALRLDGEETAFRDPWTLPLARSTYQTGSYHLIGANADTRIEAQFTARADDTLLAEYLDPDGDPAFNHITCSADCTVVVKKRSPFVGRWRDHRTLSSKHLAHFEWGARAGDVLRVKKTLQSI